MRIKYLLLLSILLCTHQLMSQPNVSLQLIKPPGTELPVDESLKAIITNNSQESLEVYLKGFVREAEDGQIFEGRSSVFVLEDRITQINKRNLEPLKPTETIFTNREYKEYITRTSSFPSGRYEICVRVYLASEEEVIAEDCYEKTVEEYLPPSLISPDNGASLTNTRPFFTWSPVPGNNAGEINYKLSVVEIMGNQSPVSAFQSNPGWYEKNGINSPLFQYPVSARNFDTTRSYAWKVTAFIGSSKIAESEVWGFRFKMDTTASEEQDTVQEEQEEVLIPEQYAGLSEEFSSGYYLLDDFQLRFIYKNDYAATHVKCRLENSSNEIVARNLLDEKQQPGMNFNKLDVTNRAEPGKTYLLRCEGPLGEVRGLRFKIRKENSDNIIDDLDWDGGLQGLPNEWLNGGG